jgi:hypothetical protein
LQQIEKQRSMRMCGVPRRNNYLTSEESRGVRRNSFLSNKPVISSTTFSVTPGVENEVQEKIDDRSSLLIIRHRDYYIQRGIDVPEDW